MFGVANFVEGVYEGALVVGLQRNAEIDCGANRGLTNAPPFSRDSIPPVFCVHVFPIWCEGRRGAATGKGPKGEGTEHREPEVMHNYKRSPRWRLEEYYICAT